MINEKSSCLKNKFISLDYDLKCLINAFDVEEIFVII